MCTIILTGLGGCDPTKKLIDINKYQDYTLIILRDIGKYKTMDVHCTNHLLQVAEKYNGEHLKEILTINPVSKIYKNGAAKKTIEEFNLYLNERYITFDYYLSPPKFFSYPLSEIGGLDIYTDLKLEALVKELRHFGNLQLTFSKKLIQIYCKEAFKDPNKKNAYTIQPLPQIQNFVIQISMIQGYLVEKTGKVYLSEILSNLQYLRIAVVYKVVNTNVQILKMATFIRDQNDIQPNPPTTYLTPADNEKYVELSLPNDTLLLWGADNNIIF